MAKKKHAHQEKSTGEHQSETNQQNQNPKMEPDTQPPAMEDPAEKLSSLKSLNAMLLKETVEKRQEVSALRESKKSLETELTRSESQIEALRAELAQMQAASEAEELRREKEYLRREKEGLEKRLMEVEREMGEVVRERDEMEKAKFEGDLEIGSMKKLENELRSEIKRGRDALSQSIRENDGLKQDLGARVEERNKMRQKMAELEAKAAEELGEVKSKYASVSKALKEKEHKIASMKIELGSVGRICEDLKKEISCWNEERDFILREKAELIKERSDQGLRINELEKEVCQLNAIILSLREDEEKWRLKFFELEKINAEMDDKIEDMGRELNAVMEDMKEKEREIESLIEEKSNALKRIAELENVSEILRQEKEDIVKGKNKLESVKSKQENVINELKHEVNELKGNLSSMKESNRDELEKNRQLSSEMDKYKNMLDRVNSERDDAKKALEKEKENGMKLQVKVSEISKKMEETARVIEELRATSDTLVREKKELEKKHSKLMEERTSTEKKFTDAQKKMAELEASLRSKNDMFDSALTLLKNTKLQISMEDEKKGGKEEMKMSERGMKKVEMEPYMAELNAIRSAFKEREEKVGEMEKKMVSLQISMEDARKKKSLWALVSSATTILAAVVSFAYASRSQ